MTGPLIGLNIGMSLIFFTAVDRLVMTLLPMKHRQINKILYLGGILTICMSCNSFLLYLGYLNANEHKNSMVVCLIVESKTNYCY